LEGYKAETTTSLHQSSSSLAQLVARSAVISIPLCLRQRAFLAYRKVSGSSPL
jgi:hypothetical protein